MALGKISALPSRRVRGRARARTTLATLLLALAFALALPTAAHATCTFNGYDWVCDIDTVDVVTKVAVEPQYKGWGQVNAYACGEEYTCELIYPTAQAWRWTGSRWATATRRNHADVYIWPFASGYMWTWTAQNGWMAMRIDDLVRERTIVGQ